MKPFLLLATRPEDALAQNEYDSFVRLGGLKPKNLIHRRLEREELGEVSLDDYSGIFLAGSPFTGIDPQESKSATQVRVEAELSALMGAVVERDFPFFGACYGIGTLGRHQGAVLSGKYAESISAPEITVTEQGRTDPIMEGVPGVFHSYVGHKESCERLPEHAVLLATAAACPVQMFRIRNNLYGTQFHPELDPPSLLARIAAYSGYGYYDDANRETMERELTAIDVSPSHLLIRNFVRLHARE